MKAKDSQENSAMEKKGYKRREAADYLGIAPITVDRLAERGLLHPSRALRHPIYSKDELDRFLLETSVEIKVVPSHALGRSLSTG